MTPVKVAVAIAGINLVLNLILIWTPLQVAGLAWSTAICSVFQVIVLHHLLNKRISGIINRTVLTALLRILLVSVFTAVGASIAALLMNPNSQPDHWFYQLISLLVIVCAGGGVTFLAARLFRMPELSWFLGRQVSPTLD